MSVALLTRQDFTPKTHDAAATFFSKKVALTSVAYERLSEENRARAFRIAKVNSARLVQRARDVVLKAIAEGSDYKDVRTALLDLFDTEGLPRPALFRLRMMFRQNVLHAYNVARSQTLKAPEIVAEFPFWEYRTVGNGTPGVNNVRPEHAALHGKVFRWDDPFWDHFDPPWEWGCRCSKVALTPGQVKAMKTEVVDLDFVRKELGIAPNPDFDFPRDSFDATQFDVKTLDADIRELVEEWINQ